MTFNNWLKQEGFPQWDEMRENLRLAGDSIEEIDEAYNNLYDEYEIFLEKTGRRKKSS